jgi:3-oxoadipate enol-lactonase
MNRRWPDLALSMVLADSFARVRPGAEDRIYATQEAVAYLSMLEFGSQYAGDRLMPSTPIEKLDELAEEISKCPPKAYVDTVRAIFTYDASDDRAAVKAPTLVVIGDSDDATPMAESEFIRDGIAGSEIKIIPDAGHLSTIDSPDEFTAELRAFLSAQA